MLDAPAGPVEAVGPKPLYSLALLPRCLLPHFPIGVPPRRDIRPERLCKDDYCTRLPADVRKALRQSIADRVRVLARKGGLSTAPLGIEATVDLIDALAVAPGAEQLARTRGLLERPDALRTFSLSDFADQAMKEPGVLLDLLLVAESSSRSSQDARFERMDELRAAIAQVGGIPDAEGIKESDLRFGYLWPDTRVPGESVADLIARLPRQQHDIGTARAAKEASFALRIFQVIVRAEHATLVEEMEAIAAAAARSVDPLDREKWGRAYLATLGRGWPGALSISQLSVERRVTKGQIRRGIRAIEAALTGTTCWAPVTHRHARELDKALPCSLTVLERDFEADAGKKSFTSFLEFARLVLRSGGYEVIQLRRARVLLKRGDASAYGAVKSLAVSMVRQNGAGHLGELAALLAQTTQHNAGVSTILASDADFVLASDRTWFWLKLDIRGNLLVNRLLKIVAAVKGPIDLKSAYANCARVDRFYEEAKPVVIESPRPPLHVVEAICLASGRFESGSSGTLIPTGKLPAGVLTELETAIVKVIDARGGRATRWQIDDRISALGICGPAGVKMCLDCSPIFVREIGGVWRVFGRDPTRAHQGPRRRPRTATR